MKKATSMTKPTETPEIALSSIGGSRSDNWNLYLVNQALGSIWHGDDPDRAKKRRDAAIDFLITFQPKDELEAMLAAQLLASHNAAMECHRRAMLPEQTFEGRHENLIQANKLSRTYSALLESLNRHRGKGQQKVTVEHVHVHEGGQAIVGNVSGGGASNKLEKQPHALGYAPGQTLRSENPEREAMPVARNAKR